MEKNKKGQGSILVLYQASIMIVIIIVFVFFWNDMKSVLFSSITSAGIRIIITLFPFALVIGLIFFIVNSLRGGYVE